MPALLILKLFLVPALIAAITLAGRRWGATVAGSLAAFPVVAGPILFFVAIEQGAPFAANAAAASILGVLGNIGFGIAYSWTCRRHAWHVSLLCGWAAYCCLIAVLHLVHVSPWQASLLTFCGLLVAGKCFPRQSVDLPKALQPKSDLVYRVLAAASLVLAVTFFSAQLGSHFTGLFAVFPVMGSVLAVFSHRYYGPGFAISILRGMVRGFYAFTVFCLVLALSLPANAWPGSFSMALIMAALVQFVVMRGQARPPAST